MQHFMACLIYGLSIAWWMVSSTGVVLLSWWLDYPLDMIGFFGSLSTLGPANAAKGNRNETAR